MAPDIKTKGDRFLERINEARRAAFASRKILRVVRAFCFECIGGQAREIPGCTAPGCPLYPFRQARSVRQGFDIAATMLEEQGFHELAAKSRRMVLANRKEWEEGRTGLLSSENDNPCAATGKTERGNDLPDARD